MNHLFIIIVGLALGCVAWSIGMILGFIRKILINPISNIKH